MEARPGGTASNLHSSDLASRDFPESGSKGVNRHATAPASSIPCSPPARCAGIIRQEHGEGTSSSGTAEMRVNKDIGQRRRRTLYARCLVTGNLVLSSDFSWCYCSFRVTITSHLYFLGNHSAINLSDSRQSKRSISRTFQTLA